MIYFEGGTKPQQQLLEALYVFCIQKLDIDQIIEIDLNFKKLDDVQAWTDYEGEGKFYIDIDSQLNNHQLITVFCHEMVHVVQNLQNKTISEVEAYRLESELAREFKLSN